MCYVCRQTPCNSRCPNASEPTPIFECKKCGYDIFSGDKYLKHKDECICEECLEEMSIEEILELFNESLKEA